MWTVVVLPAPLGPSRAKMVPSGTIRSMPSSTTLSPKDFCSPVTAIAGLAADVVVIGVSSRGGEKEGVQDRRITMSPKLVRAWTSSTSSDGSGLSAASMELRTVPKRV